MNVMAQPVLVLNGSFEPIFISSAKRALTLIVKGSAIVEEARDVYAFTAITCRHPWFACGTTGGFPRGSRWSAGRTCTLRWVRLLQYCGVEFAARI